MLVPKDKKKIERWWAENPMTYGEVHGTTVYVGPNGTTHEACYGTRAFYEEVDRTFYSWNRTLHDESGYFGKIFPYEQFRGKDVLEIGCGLGTMAMNWALHGAHVYALDLNPRAVNETMARFRMIDLIPQIVQSDANLVPFPDSSFDYVYSWGVLHHSPDIDRSIDELFRVLRTGGRFGVMLYNRSSFLYWYTILYIEGFLHGESEFLSPIQLASRYTDGDRNEGNPHTWPVTWPEMKRLFGHYCSDLGLKVLGLDFDNLLEQILPVPGLGRIIPKFMKKPWARRWGWSLWIYGSKGESPS
jgi:SAM-dependent methyltransferase